MTEGCVHIHIKDGKIKNIFCHLGSMPENGVVHLSPQQDLSEEEFIKSHPADKVELSIDSDNVIYNLGSNNI